MIRARSDHRALLLMLLSCSLSTSLLSQEATDIRPLGDVARKARSESKEHADPKHVLNDDAIAAKGERWTVSACRTLPCAELSILVPTGAKYARKSQNPELQVERGGTTHLIKLFAANQLPASDLERAKGIFLEDWFTRPYYFGTAANLEFEEATTIDKWPGILTHFTIPGRVLNYRGLALFIAVPAGTFGYACIFRADDSGDSTNICEEILNSASVRMPEKYRYFKPGYAQDDP